MQKYSKEERDKHLTEWRKSGLSGQDYCRRNNIRATTFYGWTKKERQKKIKRDYEGFVKIPVKAIEKEDPDHRIIVEYKDIRINLPISINTEYLQTIIKSIGSLYVC